MTARMDVILHLWLVIMLTIATSRTKCFSQLETTYIMQELYRINLKLSFSIATPPHLKEWTEMAETYDNLTNSVSIIINYDAFLIFFFFSMDLF